MRSLCVLLLLLSVGCATTRTATLRQHTNDAAAALRQIVPARDTATWHAIRRERIARLLPEAMLASGADVWVTFVRENANDPLAIHVGGENAGGTAAIIFFREGRRVRSLALSPAGEATALADVGLHNEVTSFERGENVFILAARAALRAKPSMIAINSSFTRAAADGLSASQRAQFEDVLGDDGSRLRPSEDLVVRWLSVKLPQEVEIMRRAALVTERLQVEAYSTVVPGQTRDADVARYLKQRMRELDFEDAWAPEQNPNVNSGPDRGHSHATNRIIQPGDIIQTDFGIKVGGIWSTDIQRFAYVLRPGERVPPADVIEKWENAKRGNRTALAAMKPGVRGYDVDVAQRAWMRERNSEPVPWSTGHPVGYWAHDMGPSLGGAQRTTQPSGDSLRQLEPGQTFAFDGFFAWRIGEGQTKTISVEEMAVVTATAAEYLIAPQEELVLIKSGSR